MDAVYGRQKRAIVVMSLFPHGRKTKPVAGHASAALSADLAAVVLGGGGTVREVVESLAESGPLPLRPCFERVLSRVAVGQLLVDSLNVELTQLGSSFHPLVGALTLADVGGASIGSILQHLSDDARRSRQAESERQAKELSVRLLIPLVVTLLPAVIIGAVVPIVVVALSGLSPPP